MRKLKLFTHCILLATTPSLLAYPENPLPQATPKTVSWWGDWWGDWWWWGQEKAEEWVRPTTYDEIMQMLEDLESGELERKYPPEQLERVNEYLATLAKEGILPNEFEEEVVLEEDTYDLMYGEDSAFQLTRYLENSSQYMIILAVLNGYSGYNIVQCGKISHAWKKTKKFVKDHKKEIIIGAVVVVAVTVVVVAVVAASSAAAATAAAGAAGAAASSNSGSGSSSDRSESNKSELNDESPPISSVPKELPSSVVVTNEIPTLKTAIDEQISSFKEFMVEDKIAGQVPPSQGWDDLSFGEKAREFGANLAHRVFDEVSDLVKVVPQFCEEVKEIGAKLLPESLSLPHDESTGSPIENYESLIAKGHQAIDSVFSTDQSELFTAAAKANDPMNNYAIGMLPLPGGVSKVFSNTTKLIESGKVLDRAEFTKAGRGLMKHGYREGSVFPKPVGDPKQINEHGQKILESIVNHPERQITYKYTKNLGEVVDIHAPGIGGVRYTASGELIGFLEP